MNKTKIYKLRCFKVNLKKKKKHNQMIMKIMKAKKMNQMKMSLEIKKKLRKKEP